MVGMGEAFGKPMCGGGVAFQLVGVASLGLLYNDFQLGKLLYMRCYGLGVYSAHEQARRLDYHVFVH